MRGLLVLLPIACACLGQSTLPQFDTASVRQSAREVGKDYRGQVQIGPASLSVRNASLKDLILEAYELQPFQVSGGPNWIDQTEYDVEARAAGPAPKDQIRAMLQELLRERFGLVSHRDSKQARVYVLVQDKGGIKAPPLKEGAAPRFPSDMRQLAALISYQLTIPTSNDPDPSRPHVGGGAPVPVLDRTGLTGSYQLTYQLRPEIGVDPFVIWQRVLQEQLGLKLETRNEPVELLVVDRAERTPAGN